jgi:hypothetical protein
MTRNFIARRLAQSRLGRVMLHLAVLLRSRRHCRWHLDGIRRAFRRDA